MCIRDRSTSAAGGPPSAVACALLPSHGGLHRSLRKLSCPRRAPCGEFLRRAARAAQRPAAARR
eukprot:14285340-Alexandrium_andersonii.AAC.1